MSCHDLAEWSRGGACRKKRVCDPGVMAERATIASEPLNVAHETRRGLMPHPVPPASQCARLVHHREHRAVLIRHCGLGLDIDNAHAAVGMPNEEVGDMPRQTAALRPQQHEWLRGDGSDV